MICVKAPKKSQISEAFLEATIREGADELTLRADEVGAHKAFINTEHIELGGGDRRWTLRKEVEGKEQQRNEPLVKSKKKRVRIKKRNVS